MSDLCYNCLETHLPQACQHPLQECTNCGLLGHAWNFCHLGARSIQPDHKYFGLCHNCQKWHLPAPCEEELVKCGGCGQHGHHREYCPLNPTPSDRFTTCMSSIIIHSLTANNAQWILHNSSLADEIYNIKMGAVMDTLKLVANGVPDEEARRHLAMVYRGTFRPALQRLASTHTQLPTPSAIDSEGWLPMPHPSIPLHTQVGDLTYYGHNNNHTLAPLQSSTTNTNQLESLENASQAHQQLKVDHAPHAGSGISAESGTTSSCKLNTGFQKTFPLDGVFSANFRTFDKGPIITGGSQEDNLGDSSGNGSMTQSSPCDDRAHSIDRKGEQEHGFLEGAIY